MKEKLTRDFSVADLSWQKTAQWAWASGHWNWFSLRRGGESKSSEQVLGGPWGSVSGAEVPRGVCAEGRGDVKGYGHWPPVLTKYTNLHTEEVPSRPGGSEWRPTPRHSIITWSKPRGHEQLERRLLQTGSSAVMSTLQASHQRLEGRRSWRRETVNRNSVSSKAVTQKWRRNGDLPR